MYELRSSRLAKKSLKKLSRSGSFDAQAFEDLLEHFIAGGKIPSRYKDHQLQGNLSLFRECHLVFDLLVIYERDETHRTVTLLDIGTHDSLF